MKSKSIISLLMSLCLILVSTCIVRANSYSGPTYTHDANYDLVYSYHLSSTGYSSKVVANAGGWASDFVTLDLVGVSIFTYNDNMTQINSKTTNTYDDYLASASSTTAWPSGSQECFVEAYFYFYDSYYGDFTGYDSCYVNQN